MSHELEPIRSLKYTPEQVQTCLHTLVYAGTSTRAAKQLEQIGIEISPERLRSFRNKEYPHRYAEIQAQAAPELRKAAEAGTLQAAAALEELEMAAIERLGENVNNVDVRDLAATIKNLTTAKAINIDKHLVQTGQPTQIIQHNDAGALLAQLRDVIDSTAHEETPEQLSEAND